ncbi:Hypothetical predicted protein [Paramuricea clavata]|uniref:Uncharacterized protein n=1 Tax=Paramuricea clavata TaxID=317549 RepID=A0A7D9EMD4_PARCT|nr:Hypothetical predicted protein [Paramuricea clavata]
MMYLRQLLGSFVLVHVLCDGIELNSTECIKTCKEEVIAHDDDLCKETCVEKSLRRIIHAGYKRELPKPVVPRIIETEWKTIQLTFNTTELANYSGLHYIVEVKPVWNYFHTRDVFTLFPYIPKYHLVSLIIKTVL